MKTNILFAIATVAIVLLALFNQKRSQDEMLQPLTFTPGTYTVEAEGYHGPVKLDVTFDDSQITDIKVVEEEETEGIGSAALPVMIERILAAHGTGVDAVTGATIIVLSWSLCFGC